MRTKIKLAPKRFPSGNLFAVSLVLAGLLSVRYAQANELSFPGHEGGNPAEVQETRNGTLGVSVAGQSLSTAAIDSFAPKDVSVTGLNLSPDNLSLFNIIGDGSYNKALKITVANGTVVWNATVTLLNGNGWLSLSSSTGTTTPTQSSILRLGVNVGALLAPGVYQAIVTVKDTKSTDSDTLPVTLALSPARSRLHLSQGAFVFTVMQNGVTPPSDTVQIFNTGLGNMAWTIPANLTAPLSWLRLSTLSGTAGPDPSLASSVTVGVNPAGLSPGAYQIIVPVSAPGATNDPQHFTVTLHVVPVSAAALAHLAPSGLIFHQPQGSTATPSKNLTISNKGGSTLSFQWQSATSSGGNWLAVSPASGNTASGPATVQVTVNPAGLSTGMYRGKLVGNFSPGVPQEVAVVLVITPAGATTQRNFVVEDACTQQSMDFVSTTVGTGSTLSVSFPRPLLVTVIDNCGNNVSDASVIASISGKSIELRPVGGGLYSGTWVPESTSSTVVISLVAVHPNLPEADQTITVSAAPAPGSVSLPVLAAGGVVEGAGFTPQRPLATGGIISVFGSRFAASDNFATRLPLDRVLGGVSVIVGGESAPLYYAGTGQINAQVPFSAQPGSNISIVVNANGQVTAPQNYVISGAEPGVFAGAVLDGQGRTVNAGNPAHAGDTLQIFTTGLGVTDPPAVTGQPAPPFSKVLVPVSVSIGGTDVTVVYQGLAPGFVGLYQVNVILASAVAPGDAVPVVIKQNGITSNPNLPINIPIR